MRSTRLANLVLGQSWIVAVALGCAADLHAAQPTPQAPPCRPIVMNGTCVVDVNRDVPVSPLPIHVARGSDVIVVVTRRPFDQIQFDLALADTNPVDPLGAVFTAFITPLKSVVMSQALRTATPPPDATKAAIDLRKALLDINNEQQRIQQGLVPIRDAVVSIGNELRAFQRHQTSGWNVRDLNALRLKLSCAALGEPPPSAASVPCTQAQRIPQLPLTALDVLDETVKAAFKTYLSLSPDQGKIVVDYMDQVVAAQGHLRSVAASLTAARTVLADAARAVNDMEDRDREPAIELRLPAPSHHRDRTATVKITAQDVISKKTTSLATVTVEWGGTRWEVSAGAFFSTLPSRSFQATPIIVNGVPKLDADGVTTQITETTTHPTIVPAVLAHYRLLEGLAGDGGQRVALLGGFGLGVNPYSGSADFAAGPTFSYRGLMVSALAHWGRDLRLTNGLQLGMELGSSPPALSTERFWVTRFAVGVSYRIPVS